MVYVAIVGSREFCSEFAVRDFVRKLDEESIVVSGGAKGPDTWAADEARSRGLHVIEIKPDWEKHGRGAGIVRNKEIVDTAEIVIAFWDGKSKGTKSTIELARKAGKEVTVLNGQPRQ